MKRPHGHYSDQFTSGVSRRLWQPLQYGLMYAGTRFNDLGLIPSTRSACRLLVFRSFFFSWEGEGRRGGRWICLSLLGAWRWPLVVFIGSASSQWSWRRRARCACSSATIGGSSSDRSSAADSYKVGAAGGGGEDEGGGGGWGGKAWELLMTDRCVDDDGDNDGHWFLFTPQRAVEAGVTRVGCSS